MRVARQVRLRNESPRILCVVLTADTLSRGEHFALFGLGKAAAQIEEGENVTS